MGWETERVGNWEGERVRIEWKSGVGGGESGDRQEEEWVGEGESGRVGWEGERVEIDRRKSWWVGEGERGDRSGVEGGEWG